MNGNDGVIHGAMWTEGKVGKALKFDEKDDYVDCSTMVQREQEEENEEN